MKKPWQARADQIRAEGANEWADLIAYEEWLAFNLGQDADRIVDTLKSLPTEKPADIALYELFSKVLS